MRHGVMGEMGDRIHAAQVSNEPCSELARYIRTAEAEELQGR